MSKLLRALCGYHSKNGDGYGFLAAAGGAAAGAPGPVVISDWSATNVAFRDWPKDEIEPIIATPTSAPISAYSIDVAPLSS